MGPSPTPPPAMRRGAGATVTELLPQAARTDSTRADQIDERIEVSSGGSSPHGHRHANKQKARSRGGSLEADLQTHTHAERPRGRVLVQVIEEEPGAQV